MKERYLIIIAILLFFFNCKKVKEQDLNDSEWRKESLEISSGICLKLESCVKEEFSKLEKGLQGYAKSELKPEKCSEKNKKSRVYLLKGNDPLKIKQVVRDCYSQILKFSCDEIRNGSIKENNSCEQMRRAQQGVNF